MDYKDAYHALRSQHSDLQSKYHDRAEELKRTNVQLSKIENLMRAKERMEGGRRRLWPCARRTRPSSRGSTRTRLETGAEEWGARSEVPSAGR